MNTTVKSIFLVTTLSLLSITAYADITNTPDIVGNYKCQRIDLSNNTSNFPLNVKKTGDTYTFEWDDNNGEPTLYGTGVMNPIMNNVISASFWDPKNSEVNGVEIFEIKPDGSLQSNWTLQSAQALGSESCTKEK